MEIMWYVVLILLIYIIWLFIKSENIFFKQDRETLVIKRQHLVSVLSDFKIDLEKDKRWLEAYDNFKNYPKYYKYDGATIVKDNHTILGYDAPAGNHDFAYINLSWFTWLGFIEKFKIDYQYGLDMRKLQIAYITAWGRVLLLCLSTPFWYGFKLIQLINKK